MEQGTTRLLTTAAGLGADTTVLMHGGMVLMAAWFSHSAPQIRQASAQAISCASTSIGLGSVRREMMRAVVRHTSEQSRQVRMQQTRSAT